VAIVRTDVSEEHIAFIIVKIISELGTTVEIVTANAIPNSLIPFTLTIEAIHSFDMSILTKATRRLIPKVRNSSLHIGRKARGKATTRRSKT
jgi:hypothetical protein